MRVGNAKPGGSTTPNIKKILFGAIWSHLQAGKCSPEGAREVHRLTRRGARVLADSPEEVLNIQIIDLQMASNGLLWLQIAIWSHLEHSESFPAQVETL